MTDVVDRQTRSRMMAGIRNKDTKPELALRCALHACGFRYRLHPKAVTGRPDLVLPKHKAVIFVHGCFWHRHPGCRFASTPSTRVEFWQAKFNANVTRDLLVVARLGSEGWRVATIWECALRSPAMVELSAERVWAWLQSDTAILEIGGATFQAGNPKH
ncbi:MAG: DNA mismatch endonuclease Vsr [bacterium]